MYIDTLCRFRILTEAFWLVWASTWTCREVRGRLWGAKHRICTKTSLVEGRACLKVYELKWPSKFVQIRWIQTPLTWARITSISTVIAWKLSCYDWSYKFNARLRHSLRLAVPMSLISILASLYRGTLGLLAITAVHWVVCRRTSFAASVHHCTHSQNSIWSLHLMTMQTPVFQFWPSSKWRTTITSRVFRKDTLSTKK